MMLIAGTLVIAFAASGTVWLLPVLFAPILLLDLWGLGYHHVIATYTRLYLDRVSRREHRFLISVLPILVLGGVVLMIWGIGFWTVPTLYLYWQWFHYTRQSWGIAQIYRRKGRVDDDGPLWLHKTTFYAIPLWGILNRSAEAPERFLGLSVRVLPVPPWLADAVGIAALALLALWLVGRFTAWRRGRLSLMHTAFVSSHFAIFLFGYCIVPSLDYGWLAINIWHNSQYVLFVWFFNRNRFRDGVSENARLLSWCSQPRRAWAYFGFCLAISTAVYLALGSATAAFASATALPLSLIVFQTINFHHYVVDALIWKVRQPKLRRLLAIAD